MRLPLCPIPVISARSLARLFVRSGHAAFPTTASPAPVRSPGLGSGWGIPVVAPRAEVGWGGRGGKRPPRGGGGRTPRPLSAFPAPRPLLHEQAVDAHPGQREARGRDAGAAAADAEHAAARGDAGALALELRRAREVAVAGEAEECAAACVRGLVLLLAVAVTSRQRRRRKRGRETGKLEGSNGEYR